MIVARRRSAFVDAGYAIAVLRSEDVYHDSAPGWSRLLRREEWRLVTTTAVLAEIGNAFAKNWYRVAEFLHGALSNPALKIVPVTEDLIRRAVSLRDGRLDKDRGVTDWISFVVMQNRGLHEALAADRHFEQAGFRALLRSDA